MYSFDYVRPSSLAEASSALAANAEATLIAGGHSLIPTLKQRLANPGVLVDLGNIAELKGIRREGGNLVIGAMTTHAEVCASAEVRSAIPALAKLVPSTSAMPKSAIAARLAARWRITTRRRTTRPRCSGSARPSSPTKASSTRTAFSPACFRPRCSPARLSPPSAFRFPSGQALRNSPQRASRFAS